MFERDCWFGELLVTISFISFSISSSIGEVTPPDTALSPVFSNLLGLYSLEKPTRAMPGETYYSIDTSLRESLWLPFLSNYLPFVT